MRARSIASSAAILTVASLAVACSSSSAAPPSTDAGHDAGHAPDAQASDAHTGKKDSGEDAYDATAEAEAAAPGITCGKILTCDMPCTTNACTNACYASATGAAQGLFDSLDACINHTCGGDAGEVCADAGSSACGTCQEGAATGACFSRLLACEGDHTVGPADPDGGTAFFDASFPPSGGQSLNCGGLVMCEGACGDAGASCGTACTSMATSLGQTLATTLADCLASACPADGGTCGAACKSCRTQAEFDNAQCGVQFSNCQDDTSNAPDGGTGPVALQGGTIRTLAAGLDQPQVVIVQAGDVYYTQVSATGPVSEVSLADGGGAPTNLIASQPYPMGLAVDGTNAYVWNSGSFSGSTTVNQDDGSVVQVPLAGGTALTLATGIEAAYAAPYLNAVAVNAGHVYWVAGANGSDGAIMTTAVGSTTASAVYTGQLFPEAVATDGNNLYWANWGTFTASGDYNNDGTILQGSIHGGAITTLASGLSAPASIFVDSTNVYWTNAGQLGGDNLPAPGTGSVMQAPIGGGTVVTLAPSQAIPLSVAVASGKVYWNEYALSAPGQIVSAPVGGGTIVPLVAGLADPFGITVSGSLLVWSDSPPTAAGSGKILALTLP